MEFYRHIMVLLIVLIAFIIPLNKAQTTVEEVSFTYDETDFRFFQVSPELNHSDAQTQCINSGGNLATISSAVEDSLLFYSSPDIGTVFTCHIGLERIGESVFEWIDGSTSSYRNWGTTGKAYPVTETDFNCVRSRYIFGSIELSQGWLNIPCDQTRNCYMCSKSGMSNGCDLIYDSSCYKVFEVSTPINWLDAQSSCAIWGGDLTSITTERENNFLNTIITSSVGNCWIGLNDRDVEGTYTWIDGTAVSYTNWTTTPSDDTNSNCVQINNVGNGTWEFVSCDMNLDAFLCKRNSSSSVPTAVVFGELIDGGLHFQTSESNAFLYNSSVLACGGSENGTIQWIFSKESDFVNSEILTDLVTYANTEFSFNILPANINKQGYYRCMVGGVINYTIGLYNQSTQVAEPGYLYTYIVVDKMDAILLCDPQNNSYGLNTLMWETTSGSTFNNPISFSELHNASLDLTTHLACVADGVTVLTCSLSFLIPTVTVSYASQQTTSVFTATTEISIPVGVENFVLSINIEGRWRLPNNSFMYSQNITYAELSYEYFGLFEFYVFNWYGNEVVGIEINVVPGGYINAILSGGVFPNGSTIKLDEDTSFVIECASPVVVHHIDWFYRTSLDDIPSNHTSNSNFSVQTGISTLIVYSNLTGYYSCVINQVLECLLFVVDRNQLIEVSNFNDPSQLIEYTVGSTSVYLYYSFSNVPDLTLLWTTGPVIDGDTSIYAVEYRNPVQLDNVLSQIGTGLNYFTCFYRMSPVTVLGSVQLAIRDTARITVSFDGYNMSFSDLQNPIFPNPQEIYIYEGTKNIYLTCSLSECVWNISHQNHPITSTTYTIPEMTSTLSGSISLQRVTPSGVTYTTAHLTLVPIQKEIEAINELSRILMILFVILLIISVTTTLVLIGTCIYFRVKKVKNKDIIPSKTTDVQLNALCKPRSVEDVNQQRMLSGSRDYVYIATNSEYTTIDEMYSQSHKTPEKSDSEYVYKSPYGEPREMSKQDSFYEFKDIDEHYEPYACMITVDIDDRYIPKVTSVEDYPTVYRQYMDEGIEKGSTLSIEFQKLNEYSRKFIEFETDEAMNPENISKNPISSIVPFNENRVLLASQNINCSYINASWLELNQFIATINPTRNTHKDFLQMIEQTGARMVVMLTTRKERVKIISGISNRVCYWCKKDEPVNCEHFITSSMQTTETKEFTKQEISLKNTSTGMEHQFTQYVSTCWEQDATVLDTPSVLSLLQEIIKQKQTSNDVPIIIHCQDGISKTGIIVTMLRMIHEISVRGSINMFSVVKSLRRQRISMVPTFECYTTCYSLLNEYCSTHF